MGHFAAFQHALKLLAQGKPHPHATPGIEADAVRNLAGHLSERLAVGQRAVASARYIAERVCANMKTVVRSSTRLKDRGVLGVETAGSMVIPTKWGIVGQSVALPPLTEPLTQSPTLATGPPELSESKEDAVTESNTVSVSTLCVMYVPKHFAFHEIWARKGLGKAALRVWTLFRRQSTQSSSELAKAARVSPRQMQAQLGKLRSHGLARTLKRGQWEGLLPTAADLDKLADSIGVAGLRGRLQEAHERDRRKQRGADRRLAAAQYRATKGTRRLSKRKPRG